MPETTPETPKGDTAVKVAHQSQKQQAANQAETFPEEGTDEKILKPGAGDTELAEDVRLKATRAVLDHDKDT